MDFHSSRDSTPAHRRDPAFVRVLKRLPQDMVDNFSDSELNALEEAIGSPKRHSIDIRLTIPCLPKKLYFVLLVGQDRRTNPDRPKYKWQWTPQTALIATSLGLLTAVTGYIAVSPNILSNGKSLLGTKSGSNSHPTILPWIESEAACNGAQQVWKDGHCFDSEHSREF